jgi:hypothetical protein
MTRLEKTTNVALIVACIVLVGNLARNYYLSSSPDLPAQHELRRGQ